MEDGIESCAWCEEVAVAEALRETAETERDRLAGELEEARLDAKQHWTHARQADAERAAAVAGEARLRAALEVTRVAIESTHARGGGVRDTIDAALAAPPSAALTDLRRLRELLQEVAWGGVEFEDERVRYVSVQLDRDDFRERIPAALAATAFLGEEGEAGDG
jgi:hypothetical protein